MNGKTKVGIGGFVGAILGAAVALLALFGSGAVSWGAKGQKIDDVMGKVKEIGERFEAYRVAAEPLKMRFSALEASVQALRDGQERHEAALNDMVIEVRAIRHDLDRFAAPALPRR